jgi:hypothetical protein
LIGRPHDGSQETVGPDVVLYVSARGGEAQANRGGGDNPAIALLSVFGNMPPAKVVINEMTTAGRGAGLFGLEGRPRMLTRMWVRPPRYGGKSYETFARGTRRTKPPHSLRKREAGTHTACR